MKINLSEKEFRLLTRIVKEAEEPHLTKEEVAQLVDEFEYYVSDNGLEIRREPELIKACNDFFADCGHEELVRTFAVDQVCDYIHNNYDM